MRKLKFRFWIEKEKKMCSWELMKKECNRLSILEMDGFIPLQFTGLLDKQGKEIYEGDIVKGIHSEQNGKNVYEIKDVVKNVFGGFEIFSKPMQDFIWIDNQKIRDIHWVQTGHNNIPDIYYKIVEIEIIGNIYEHPHLLQTKEVNNG